jgi:hypothetical protein
LKKQPSSAESSERRHLRIIHTRARVRSLSDRPAILAYHPS